MSEHLPLRSSVGSRDSAPLSHQQQQQQQQQYVTPYPRTHGKPNPLASVWIRRLHLAPNPPPPPPHSGFAPPPPHSSFAPPPPLHEHEAVSNRSAGFGPFRWSPRPQRDAPVGAWDAAPAPAPPMTSPFFRSQPTPLPAVADVGEFAPVRTSIGFSSGAGGFPGLSSRATVDVYAHSSWLAAPAAGIQHILYSRFPLHVYRLVPCVVLC
ncbi:hypothetical protein ACQ4PT_044321 [Festuca glaucescens]